MERMVYNFGTPWKCEADVYSSIHNYRLHRVGGPNGHRELFVKYHCTISMLDTPQSISHMKQTRAFGNLKGVNHCYPFSLYLLSGTC